MGWSVLWTQLAQDTDEGLDVYRNGEFYSAIRAKFLRLGTLPPRSIATSTFPVRTTSAYQSLNSSIEIK
jgi:hypothetical protein